MNQELKQKRVDFFSETLKKSDFVGSLRPSYDLNLILAKFPKVDLPIASPLSSIRFTSFSFI